MGAYSVGSAVLDTGSREETTGHPLLQVVTLWWEEVETRTEEGVRPLAGNGDGMETQSQKGGLFRSGGADVLPEEVASELSDT